MVLAIDAPTDLVYSLLDTAWGTWCPRPDNPANFEEQTAYVNARDLVSFAVAGNASGKTESSAFKCANFVLNTPPPRPNTPFWIIGDTYKQVSGTCWSEKLEGKGFIPPCEYRDEDITWYDSKVRWPLSVKLKPWPNGHNWLLEFMSYEQGRHAMQARSIGGFWFSEQFPWPLFVEVLRGCRDYMFPGGQFAEFTPIQPELCAAIEAVMDNPPKGWKFYRMNTEANRPNLAAGWYDSFFDTVPDEMIATRKIGTLASFQGVIFQSYNPAVHVVADDSPEDWKREIARLPYTAGSRHYRAVDWGSSEEHPQTCVWGAEDAAGNILIYDEYWSNDQRLITRDHAAAILARSLAWGWPRPKFFEDPGPEQEAFVTKVEKELAEIMIHMNGARRRSDGYRHWGESYADPSRPGEMNEFTQFGIPLMAASNEVYTGIDRVRSLLKINPITGRPRLFFHTRCKHLCEEFRKYRWKKRKQTLDVTLGNAEAPKPEPFKKWDDTVDATRYLVKSIARDRDITPGSTSSAQPRKDINLDRRGCRPMQAAQNGFFRR